MKKLILPLILVVLGLSWGCREKPQPPAAPAAAATVYQCPMHPEIVRDRPGECPICRMRLQPVTREGAPGGLGGQADRVAIELSAGRRQLIGVTVGAVETRDLIKVIRASGRIAYDPGLYAAIEEYRQALNTLGSLPDGTAQESRALAQSIVRSTKMKLRLLGLSEEQISAAPGRGEARGLVLGQAGGSVWVYADVYEYEVNLVRPGQGMTITSPALPGEVFLAAVAAVDPVINPATRTARVRAEIKNPQGRFRPEMYLEARIDVPLGRRLAVPRDAVIDTGERRLVFVAGGEGRFEPRELVLGAEAEGWLEVKSGVSEGERVATSANFLIDSESRFRAAAEAFRAGAEPPAGAHPH